MENIVRVVDQSKYIAIFALAQQGMVAKDIIEISPDNIKVSEGVTIVNINGKTAELSLDEAKVFAKYIKDNLSKIKEYNVLFFGKLGKLSVPNVTKGFRTYLAKHKGLTLHDVGWITVAQSRAVDTPIETIDDIAAIIGKLHE